MQPLPTDFHGNQGVYQTWHSVGAGQPFIVPNGGASSFTGNWSRGEFVDPGPLSISGTVTTSSGNPIHAIRRG